PKNVSLNEAAGFPLTSLTASETLFEVFNISTNKEDNKGKSILIINGAGGVGSMATQIAKHYGLTVITTASKDEAKEWSKSLGADVVLNHKNDLRDEFKAHHLENVEYVFCTFDTDLYYEVMIDLVKPRGHIATIVAFTEKQDLNLLKAKSITFTHEFMFTRALQDLDDQYQYHRYLREISHLISEGVYKPTVTEVMKGLSVDNIFKAHEKLENHEVHGKLVIEVEE
ncbi:zinc-binding dehydrogenase, partial [Nosocomiicoccus sp. HMSC059G07]|uniref:zinc-binding dehydrogenase n=1 Tax=Nosocomiicoccus sp. HMSC059G07 TaxID=1739531 RepID=UPI0008A6079B